MFIPSNFLIHLHFHHLHFHRTSSYPVCPLARSVELESPNGWRTFSCLSALHSPVMVSRLWNISDGCSVRLVHYQKSSIGTGMNQDSLSLLLKPKLQWCTDHYYLYPYSFVLNCISWCYSYFNMFLNISFISLTWIWLKIIIIVTIRIRRNNGCASKEEEMSMLWFYPEDEYDLYTVYYSVTEVQQLAAGQYANANTYIDSSS